MLYKYFISTQKKLLNSNVCTLEALFDKCYYMKKKYDPVILHKKYRNTVELLQEESCIQPLL